MKNKELKHKCKKIVIDYLKTKGWPDKLNNEQILKELPNLWKELEKDNIVMDELKSLGGSYNKFVQVAAIKKQEQDIMDQLGEFFIFR